MADPNFRAVQRSWTEAEVEQLQAHFAAGLSTAAIAHQLDRSYGSVDRKLDRVRLLRGTKAPDWQPDAVETLRELCADGLLHAWEIAAKLTERHGRTFTRCAVIGKIDRLGISWPFPKRQYRSRKSRKPRREPRRLYDLHRAKNRLRLVWSEPVIWGGIGVCYSALNEGDNRCRYVLGEPRGSETLYCGTATLDRSSYCGPHHQLCHIRIGAPAVSGAA